MKLFSLLTLIPLAAGHAGHHEEKRNKEVDNPVLMISFDGFRWDYVLRLRNLTKQRGVKNNFERAIHSGVWAKEGINNAYSTVTFPNHYTLATGLYEESHGIIGNSIWDPKTGKSISLAHEKDKSTPLYGGEPVWQTFAREKGADKVACFSWVGCDQPINGVPVIPHQIPYSSEKQKNCSIMIDQGLEWLEEGMKLQMLYYHEPDHSGHGFGPDSKEVNEKLLEINACLGSLLDALDKHEPKANLILGSDHGMIKFSERLCIGNRPDLFQILANHYSHLILRPLPGKEAETRKYLESFQTKVQIFSKEEIPERLHYKKTERIQGFLIMGKLGIALCTGPKESCHCEENPKTGGHGYDNVEWEMKPFMIAEGPALKSGVLVDPSFHSVDVYLLLCTLLGLVPAANNGSLSLVDGLLSPHGILHSPHKVEASSGSFLIVAGVSLGAVMMAFACIALHRWSKKRRIRRADLLLDGPRDNRGFYAPLRNENPSSNGSRSKMTIDPIFSDSDDSDFDQNS